MRMRWVGIRARIVQDSRVGSMSVVDLKRSFGMSEEIVDNKRKADLPDVASPRFSPKAELAPPIEVLSVLSMLRELGRRDHRQGVKRTRGYAMGGTGPGFERGFCGQRRQAARAKTAANRVGRDAGSATSVGGSAMPSMVPERSKIAGSRLKT
jgi:hypothetical protein